MNLGLGLGLGLLGGIALAFIRDNMDNTVCTPEQVEAITSLPSLGFVPDVSSKKGQRGLALRKKSALPCSMLDEPMSQLAESYRALRTSLLLSNVDAPPKVLLVTSALPQEGKSTTSLNIAIALAQHEAKVLLIDADLRRPTLHTRLKLNSAGLSGALGSRNGYKPETVEVAGVPNLHVLPAGVKPPFPAEILGSQRMDHFLQGWREQFDFVE